MNSIINSFWFWLLIIGILIVLTAVLIAGGMKKMHGWTWGIFIVGCVLAIMGIIFGLIAWKRNVPCKEEILCSKIEGCEESPYFPMSSSSPMSSNPLSSRIGTPTLVTTNIPQAKRGFATTSLTLNNLAPQT